MPDSVSGVGCLVPGTGESGLRSRVSEVGQGVRWRPRKGAAGNDRGQAQEDRRHRRRHRLHAARRRCRRRPFHRTPRRRFGGPTHLLVDPALCVLRVR